MEVWIHTLVWLNTWQLHVINSDQVTALDLWHTNEPDMCRNDHTGLLVQKSCCTSIEQGKAIFQNSCCDLASVIAALGPDIYHFVPSGLDTQQKSSTWTTPKVLMPCGLPQICGGHMCCRQDLSETFFLLREMFGTPKGWKTPNHTNTWRYQKLQKNLENTEPQQRQGQKKENPAHARL